MYPIGGLIYPSIEKRNSRAMERLYKHIESSMIHDRRLNNKGQAQAASGGYSMECMKSERWMDKGDPSAIPERFGGRPQEGGVVRSSGRQNAQRHPGT